MGRRYGARLNGSTVRLPFPMMSGLEWFEQVLNFGRPLSGEAAHGSDHCGCVETAGPGAEVLAA